MAPPRFEAEEEVRFAVVLYGGVSLAIYINGVVQELLQMVRATAPSRAVADTPAPQDAFWDDDALESTDSVYRKLGRMGPDDATAAADGPIRRRFVVDILSGTSAGGINAIYLAKAIALQGEIGPLRDLWVKEAGIADLLSKRLKPRSLLSGRQLFKLARKALDDMQLDSDGRPSPYADELDLAITTTDLQGLPVALKLAGQTVDEMRHRNVLRFKYATENAYGAKTDDFTGNDALLAFAARCTSAFPFAFEPAVAAEVLRDTPPAEWDAFFPDYVARGAEYGKYAFADGGYLDNKPFSYATEALRRRRADFPVQRKVLYVEPDPAGVPGESQPVTAQPAPDAFENAVAALLLPRHETIREDLEAVLERNETVARIRQLTVELGKEILDGDDPLEDVHDLVPETSDAVVLDALKGNRLAYAVYLQMRFDSVLDDLAAALVRRGGGRDDPADIAGMRALAAAAPSTKAESRRAFLHRYDVRFRIRRIAFLQDRLNERSDPDRQARKRELNQLLIALRTAGRGARDDTDTAAQALLTAVRKARKEAKPGESPEPAKADEHFKAVQDKLAAALAPAFRSADDYAPPDATLRKYHRRFASFDLVSLPLTYPGLEDVNPVQIVRVAPEDATHFVDERDGKRGKLAGVRLGHFGGFLDERWRRNDLLWGRLDGAELILRTLFPGDPEGESFAKLRDEALGTILREELDPSELTGPVAAALAQSDNPALVAAFKQTPITVPPLEPDPTSKVAARAAHVTGKILDQAAADRGWPRQPGFWLARAGRALWGVIEIANPVGRRPGLRTLAFGNWGHLALLLAVVLIVVGAVGVDAAQQVGWLLLAGTLAVLAAGWIAGALLSRRGRAIEPSRLRWQRRVVSLVVLAGVALLIAERIWLNEWFALVGFVVLFLGLAGVVYTWVTTPPDRLRLVALGVAAALIVVALAVVEVARHAEKDASALVATLPGAHDNGPEGAFRKGWDRVWPWSGAPALRTGVVGLAGERGDIVIDSDDGFETVEKRITALQTADTEVQRLLGDLLARVMAERTQSNTMALQAFLREHPQLSPHAAALVLAVLAGR